MPLYLSHYWLSKVYCRITWWIWMVWLVNFCDEANFSEFLVKSEEIADEEDSHQPFRESACQMPVITRITFLPLQHRIVAMVTIFPFQRCDWGSNKSENHEASNEKGHDESKPDSANSIHPISQTFVWQIWMDPAIHNAKTKYHTCSNQMYTQYICFLKICNDAHAECTEETNYHSDVI